MIMRKTVRIAGLGLALALGLAAGARAEDDPDGRAFQHSRFYVGLDGGLLVNNADDVQQLIKGSGWSTSSGIGGTYALKVGWQSRLGLAVEAGYQGLGRAVNVDTGASTTLYFNADESTVYVEPLWRIPVARWFCLGAGLGLGVTQDRVILTNSSDNSSIDLSGSGTALWPELRGQFLIARRVGLELSLGYRIQETGTMDNGQGHAVTQPDGSNWHVKNDGVQAGLGVNLYFGRL
jgi:hypothetical protein